MLDKRILVVDCQVFQTPSWHRGMGKYSMALLEALLISKEYANLGIHLLFNSNLPDNEDVINKLAALQGQIQIMHTALATPRNPRTEYSVRPTMNENKRLLNSFIEQSFSGSHVDFMILALYLDEVCPVFPDGENISDKLIIYYDSIPYLYHERYGQFKGFFDNFYLPHTATVYEASKILTISKTVANDLHVMFGIPESKIFSIDGASIRLQVSEPTKPKTKSLQVNSFVLMPSGQELRKNNYRAVQGFELFRTKHGSDIKLVVTSTFTEEAKKELKEMCPNVIFTGNVSESELLWLYQNAKFVFFATEYEGLGLPILEAVDYEKLIACSEIPVFKEISQNAFNYFDPLNVEAIASGLAITNQAAHNKNEDFKKAYKLISKKYTWTRTVDLLVHAINTSLETNTMQKKRIAIFCPDPSGFSAIGKVVVESHACYSQFFNIDYYFDRGPNHKDIRQNILPELARSYDAENFTADDYEKYDAMIYHIGNSEYHLNIIGIALAFPGYVILHDTNLDGAYANLADQGYLSEQRYDLERLLDKLVGATEPKTSTLLTTLVNSQKGILVHSEYAKSAVMNKLVRHVTLKKVNLPVDAPIYTDILHRTSERLTISLAGIIAKVKGTDIIESIAMSDDFAGCNINIFGYAAVEPERLDKLKALPHVNLTTNPTDFEFQKLMSATDILINVRLSYKGETSLTTLEQMRFGGTVMVRDFGWYSELPDDTVVKVNEIDAVLPVLKALVDDHKKLEIINQKSLDYIRRNHTHEQYAKSMNDLINQTASL